MKEMLFLLALLLFFSPSFGLEAELENKTISVTDNYVHNMPKINLILENTGNGTAVIKDVDFEISRNYFIDQAPDSILPGRTGLFSFFVSQMDCSDYNSDFEYNISIKYDKNSTTQDFFNYSGTFSINNGLSMNTTQETIPLYVGEVYKYPIILKNLGSKLIVYNVSMSPGFYVQLLRSGEVYDVADLDDQDFMVSYSDLLTLKIFGTEIMQKYFDFEIIDVECPSVSIKKKFFVKTYTKTGGLADVTVSPDLGIFSYIILLFLGVFAIAKIYKTD